MPTEPEWIDEEKAAAALGVNREVLRTQRPHLGPGECRKHGNAFQWLASTVERIAATLGLQFHEKNAPPIPATNPDQPAAPAEEELTVYSQPMGPNKPHFAQSQLFKAKRANGEIVVVRVTDSRKFLPKLRKGQPMTFKAKKAAAGNWWQLIGREPRFPGQW